MRKYRLIYLVMLMAAIAFAIGLKDRLSSVTLIAALCIPVLSGIPFALFCRSIRARISPEELVIQKDEPAACHMTVVNRGLYPFTRVRMAGNLPDAQGKAVTRQQLFFELAPRHTVRSQFAMQLAHRGEYAVGVEYMDVYDILGLFHFRIRLNLHTTVAVLPRHYAIEGLGGMPPLPDQSDRNMLPSKGQDKADLSHIREYRDGDALKSVHWKLSARQEELMVKVYEDDSSAKSVVICDVSAPYTDEALFRTAVDGVIEAATALSYRLVADSQAGNVYWHEEEPRNIRSQPVTMQAEFDRLYRLFASVQGGRQPLPLEEIISLVLREQPLLSGVYLITGNLSQELLGKLPSIIGMLAAPVYLLYIQLEPELDGGVAAFVEQTGARLWQINPSLLAQSINIAVAEGNKNGLSHISYMG